MKDKELKLIDWKTFKELESQGFEIFRGGDAEKANSEHFLVLRRDKTVMIICPTFLRGPITINNGSIGY